ncbi:MAG: type II toxin-antitoxin system RelE/ParE family toxin [Candidatus Cloacimonetes bacterium]|nr:type II toxin-antitoxin system RelE/ParE family toxin [Candidatus Cloacimonadota bacterium]MBL7086723.1 type II toxin-antitoxin system RelE/ParE family toxin [Candidatus Cloacimonadota bacterium]
MKYKIQIEKDALNFLKKIKDRKIKDKIKDTISKLTYEPRPTNVKKLKGLKNYWRIRIQNFRIVYKIIDEIQTVIVIKIGDRKDIYKR